MWRARPATPDDGADVDREQTAARRLALLAADLGSGPGADVTVLRPAVPHDDAAVPDGANDDTRVTPARRPTALVEEAATLVPAGEAAEAAAAPAIPRAGRHADRRRLPLPEVPGFGPAHLAVVAVVVAVALAGTTWWLLRDRAEPVTAPAASTGAEPLVAVTSDTPTEAAAPETVTVDVAGKVRRPGIVVLDQGARVIDALEAAGGPRKGVATTGINLARVLADGEQIVVGVDVPKAAQAPAPQGSEVLVNINTAGSAELEELPGVGPVTAAAIIEWRDQHGGFSSVDQLIDVDGIGEKTLEEIAPHATV